MLGFILFFGFFMILILWGIMIRNNIVRYFNATRRAWSEVANFELQKVKTLDHLEKTLAQYTQFEKSTLEKVTELRQQIMHLNLTDADTSQLQRVEQLNQELMRNLNIVVENYPELKADSLYSQMMQEIHEQNENVSAAITIFNRNVEAFNNQIEVFPNNMINTITLSKKSIRPFRDPITQQNYSYRPNF
ncbi:LemA family protein [Acinetobacter sp. MB5]|uniref:LemA family protein n=1 Tax=Acinetobacter sp. MB5 TaxID=2069438 RepID=UPI000DD047B0|nr:LemA family protein [Acinetobacter sp. MB5]